LDILAVLATAYPILLIIVMYSLTILLMDFLGPPDEAIEDWFVCCLLFW